MYYDGKNAPYMVTIRAAAPDTEEKVQAEQSPASKRDSLNKIFGNKYMALALMGSGIATMYTAIANPANPRSGIQSPAECRVTDIGNKKSYHFVEGKPEDVLSSCARVFNDNGFKLGEMSVAHAVVIKDIPGMDGKIGSPYAAMAPIYFGEGQDKEAKQKIDKMAFAALELKMKWYGQAPTFDWTKYELQKLNHASIKMHP